MLLASMFFGIFYVFYVKIHAQSLCNVCDCTNTTSKVPMNVTCKGGVADAIFKDKNPYVKKLIIENGEFFELKSTEKFTFENLTELDLSHNKIGRISDNVFCKLTKMEILRLNNNGLEYLNASSFQGEYTAGVLYPLRALRTIYLDHNNLRSLTANLFERTERVENLYLSWNPFKVIDTQTAIAITNLPNLKILDLSYTRISDIPQYFLHTPRKLNYLNLSGNKFKKIPKNLKESQKLETLEFNDNLLVNLTAENGFPELPNLRTLHLCQMSELTSIESAALSNLTSLENLYIAENPRLCNIDEGFLARKDTLGTYTVWPNLKKFYLNDNRLSYVNKSMIARWENLVELDLTENPWTCEFENQWMIDVLIPIYLKIDEEKAKKIRCAAPVEMNRYTFFELYEKNYKMRRLDFYGAEPEKDVVLVIGMFAGVLIGIPIILLVIFLYKKHWFGIFDDSPAAFSRQFYKRTNENYES